MSTKEKMLGKESNNKKAHRHYSLLLLALLFIGFATYGTYAYFTSSTSTTKGYLTLNGAADKYGFGSQVDSSGNIKHVSGDGLADTSTPVYSYDSTSSTGSFSNSTVDNSTELGEFNWVYIGNAGTDFSNVYTKALAKTNTWQYNNKVIPSSDIKGDIFNSVTGGDVFRKTVRLKVEGTGTQLANVKVDWNGEKVDLTNISAQMNVKIGKKAASLDLDGSTNSTVLGEDKGTENELVAKAGDTIEVTLVAYVSNNNLDLPNDGTSTLLGQIERNLTISLAQNRDLVSKSGSTTTAQN